ncbi:o-succinylbenzoate synthase [Sporolactobacillus sp. THM7-7]|nr:o-succinylbenzoate synthase [Sporolactobacillus sp. THM7-7]
MDIDNVTLRLIASPLKIPFSTHLETVTERKAIIVEVRDREGRCGFGEADPFSSPWYTEETVTTCWHMLQDFLIPIVLQQGFSSPERLDALWSGIRRNNMAKSGLSQAIWDLYAQQKGVYLGRLFGAERTKVEAGAVIAAGSGAQAVDQIARFTKAGYRRYKIKISKAADIKLLTAIRRVYPDTPLMADANASYTLQDLEHLKRLDAFSLQMIEQPLAYDDLAEHAVLQSAIETPICLDESICSFHDARSALMLGSCKVVNVKMARVGGWGAAVRIHDLCFKNNIPVWCGGMIEFGISKAHHIALASLKGFTLPGDLFSSSRYWDRDIVDPEIKVRHGFIKVPEGPGIGFKINKERLNTLTVHRLKITKQALE